jgi:divinyl protochlorophyllide a 8-vinyl-reductase
VNATAAGTGPIGRIGPNAITRVAEALLPRLGAPGTRRLFEHAGLAAYVDAPPQAMVDEAEVIALHAALRAELGNTQAKDVAADAGRRTAEYLLAHRIPRPAQRLLTWLPAPLAARVLLRAIGGHAWTFAGSGHFSARVGWRGRPVILQIEGNPLCRGLRTDAPACDFYTAVFQRLFEVLVHPRAQVIETACEARGDPACRFEVRW